MNTDPARALGKDGPGTYALETAERAWVFHDLSQADKAEYSQWCKRRVAAEATALGLAAVAVQEIAAGAYDWALSGPREGLARFLKSVAGVTKLLELLLRQAQPWVTEEQCEDLLVSRPKEVAEAIRVCLAIPFPEAKGPTGPN